MRFPAIRFWPLLIPMPACPKRCTTKPRTDVLPLVMARPVDVAPAPMPSRTTQLPCVVASMVTGSLIAGSAAVSWMVCTPGPGIAKVMLSAPAAAFAAVIASRRLHVPSHVPSPGSFVVVTTKDAARACGGTTAASSGKRPVGICVASRASVSTVTSHVRVRLVPTVPVPSTAVGFASPAARPTAGLYG